MVFHSLAFVPFIAAFFVCYFVSRRFSQHEKVLVLFSCIFYGWWDGRFLFLLAFSAGIDFYASIKIDDSDDSDVRKRWLWLGLASNLSILFTFKYFNFFSTELAAVLNLMGMSVEPLLLNLILPVGLSYYTFQSMGYTIDVYRGEIPAERNATSFFAFISFFPNLVAGPIEKAAHLLRQIKNPSKANWGDIQAGLFLMLVGYFKKIVIAERLQPFVNSFYDHPEEYGSGLTFLMGAYFIFFFVYCDFSGYTSIAMGVARMMGIRLVDNFLTPFMATSPSEFFERWHISMTNWIKNNLLLPLALWTGRIGFSLFVALIVMGLWHGASINFILWGVAVFIMTVFFHYLALLQKRLNGRFSKFFSVFRSVFMKTVFFFFAASPFRMNDLRKSLYILKKVGGIWSDGIGHSLEVLLGDIGRHFSFPGLGVSDFFMSCGFIIGLAIFQHFQGKRSIEDYLFTMPKVFRVIFVGCLIVGLLFFRPSAIDDRYFYFQF